MDVSKPVVTQRALVVTSVSQNKIRKEANNVVNETVGVDVRRGKVTEEVEG